MINRHLGSIPEKFFHSAIQNRERTAFIYRAAQGWKTLSYGEFLTKVSGVAQMLKARNISSQDRIAICSENRPEWCAVYIAATSIGAICVPIDSELGRNEIFNIFNHSNSILVFTSEAIHEKVLDASKNAGIDVINFESHEFMSTWQSSSPAMVKEMSTVSANDLASIIYTSGTTGNPKGVMLTHYNFSTDADSLISTNLISSEDNILAVLPLHHAYPFMCAFILPILLGATITYPGGLTELIETIKTKEVTAIVAVPKLLEMILNGIETKMNKTNPIKRLVIKALRASSSSLRGYFELNIGHTVFSRIHKEFGQQFRFFVSGGAKLLPETMKRLEAYGFTVIEGYGLTETSPVVTFTPIDHRKPGSAGIAIRDVLLKIDASHDEEGEILVKGPMVMEGYYQLEEVTQDALKDGWFHTGDIGFIDSEGYLFITGRKKEVIVLSSGKNVYPEDIERHYSVIPLIKEICVYGDEQKGSTAIIVPDTEEAKKQNIANIHDFLKREISVMSLTLPSYMRLHGFSLTMEPFPKTALGKIQRFLVKENIEKAKTKKFYKHITSRPAGMDEFSSQVIDIIKTVTGNTDDISPSDNLELDLGLDSLKKIELVVELERVLRFNLPETFIFDVQSVFELTEKLRYYSSLPVRDMIKSDSGSRFNKILEALPTYEELKSIGLSRRHLERSMVSFILFWIKLFFKIFFFATIKGRENLIDAPFILCPNHSSYFDAFLISSLLPKRLFRDIFFQGSQRVFSSSIMSKFAAIAHVIPIDPDTFLTKALTLSSYLLRNKKSLCIFPEGGRTFDGTISEFKKGIAILAAHDNVPLIPVYIKGSYKALPRNKRFPRLAAKITITIGKPIYPHDTSQKFIKVNHQELADKVREGVMAMAGMK
jgi:long-chain acyl-CoA synthetase